MQATGRPYHHGRLRETLVDAAFALARTGGPEAVVLRAVSRQAGVSHNAAYRHFADHEELLTAVAERCMAALAALMTARVDAVGPEDDPAERAWARLAALGRAYVEFAVGEPGWFRTAFTAAHPPVAEPQTAPDPCATGPSEPAPAGGPGPAAVGKPGSAAVGEAAAGEPGPYELLGARLDELVAAGALPAERRPGAEFAAWSAVHGLSSLLVEGPLRGLDADQVEQAVGLVVAAVRRGL